MKTTTRFLLAAGLLVAASIAAAQRPGDGPPRSADADDLVARMMEFDKDKDGKLARAEVTDARLLRLFGRADANGDGTVTREELTALAAKEQAGDRGFGPPGGGPGGPMMGFGRPGEVLPPMIQQRLGVSADQKAEVEALQKEVDARLAKILTDEQNQQFQAIRTRGPGGPGGRGGPGGPGGGPGGRGRPPGDGPPPE